MKRLSGLKLFEEREGEGLQAETGDRVVYGVTFIDHTIVLGQRQAIAGIEYALLDMKAGGNRKVRISPHLAYRDKGIPDLISAVAVLIVEVWLRAIA